jgi:hypothetical protein
MTTGHITVSDVTVKARLSPTLALSVLHREEVVLAFDASELLLSSNWARHDADEMVIAENLGERKALLLARSDAIVVMAGGLGTLDEATDILEQRKHGLHDKPVVLLNTAGFYDGLTLQLQRMEDEGFLPVPLADLVFVTDDNARALTHLEESVALH